MSQATNTFNIKLEGRVWRYRLRYVEDDQVDRLATPEALQDVDVLVVRGRKQTLISLQGEIRERHAEYSATLCADPDPFLVIGPQRLIARFVRGFSNQEVQPPQSGAAEVAMGRYPDLPSLADVPRLVREGVVDPFGINETLLAASWSEAAAAAGSLAARVHATGTAVALPEPDPGSLDPWTLPWSAVVHVQPDQPDMNKVRATRGADEDWTNLENLTGKALDLVQRCLVAVCASRTIDDDILTNLENLVEQVGYCLIASSAPGDCDESVEYEFHLGELIARLHSYQFIHGDIHRENFAYNREERRAIVLDAGSVCLLRRKLTATERARDVAVFKVQCTAERWEAFKLGYLLFDGPSEDTAAVFALV